MLLVASLALTGCCNSIATVPRLPDPAADLMRPAPTGSEYLESVSVELKASRDELQQTQADLAKWQSTLQGGLTK